MDTQNYLVVDSVEKLYEAIERTRKAQKVFACRFTAYRSFKDLPAS